MKNDKKRVARARKFVGGLALVIAMSGFTGCSFNKKDADINHDHSYTIENTIESDASYEDTHEHNHEEENVDVNEQEESEDEVIEESEEQQEEETVEEDTNNSSKDDTTITLDPVIDVDLSLELPNIGDYQGISIVEALARAGYKFDFNFRKQIASKLGIQNYRGTAEQNLEMIRLLRQYSESLKQNQDNGVTDPSNQDQNTNNNDNNGNDHDQDIGEPPIHNHNYKLVSSRTRYTNLGERGHRVTKYYTCECGNTITRSSVKNHNITTEQVHENETDEGYDLVTYEVCATCGYKKEISREHVSVHNHVLGETQYDTPVEIANDHVNHSVTSYQECSVCHERVNVRTLTKPHNYTTLPVRYEGGFEYTDEECRECGHSHNLAINPHNHTLGESHESYKEISGNDDQHEVISYQECSKCHEKVYGPTRLTTHNYGDWSYNDQTDKDERTCNDCGHTQSRTHQAEHAHTASEYRYKNYEEITDDDTYHNVTKYQVCTDCGDVISEVVIKQSHSYEEWSYNERLGLDERICSHCSHVEQRVHQHDLGGIKYDDPVEITGDDVNHNVTSYQECSKCHERVNEQTSTEAHTYGDWSYNSTTGEDERTCSDCGHTQSRTHEHTSTHNETRYVDKTESGHRKEVWKVCDDCSNDVERVSSEYVSHSSLSASEYVVVSSEYVDNGDGTHTYTEVRKCPDCGETWTYTNIVDHVLVGEEITSYEEITGDNSRHYKVVKKHCSSCNEDIVISREYENHNLNDVEENGIITSTCTSCGHSHTTEICAHDWINDSYSDGKLHRHCSKCDVTDEIEHTHVYDQGPTYRDGKDVYSCSCGKGEELRDHTNHTEIVNIEIDNSFGFPIYKVKRTCSLCLDIIDEYEAYDVSEIKPQDLIDSGLDLNTASVDPVGFSARSYAAPTMVEDSEEEEELPLEEVVEESTEEETNNEETTNEEQFNEEDYNEENYRMYVEFIENEYNIEGVNVYITPSSETEEENEEEKGAPVR